MALSAGACAELPDQTSSIKDIQTASAKPVIDGASTTPPPGFVSFCMRSPQACTAQAAPVEAKVALDDRMSALLIAVNARVNDSITYESDEVQFGVANRWTLNAVGGYGDCKDYALAKREALKAAGLPDSALRIAIVRTERDELHAVLTVETNRGVLVLDSLTGEIRPWSETPYRWLMRQAADSPLHWVKMADSANLPANPIFASVGAAN